MIRLGYKTLPTHDLYFRAPLRDLISEGIFEPKSRPIRRLGDNAFLAGDDLVLIRYLSGRDRNKLRKTSWNRCFYVIDDDFACLEDDQSLPEDYRQRLLAFKQATLPEILDLADVVVAPNRRIFDAYPGKKHLLLHPACGELCQDFSHFADQGPVRILFPGTRSHLADLDFIAEILRTLCEEFSEKIQCHTFLGKDAPGKLRGMKNIIHRKACSWPRYQKIMASECYHICLSPTLDTAFNQARSINKLFDCAAFGAAGLYSSGGPMGEVIEHGYSGLLVGNDPNQWDARLRLLIEDQGQAQNLATQGVELAERVGNPDLVRGFWQEHLRLA